MEKITFTCETITPMFLSGADGQTPELRAPSIKGALRFWWRAMNGHLSLEELKKRETEIFGGVNPARRSRVVIRVEKPLTKTFQTKMLPHKETTWKATAFCPNQEFIISFSMPSRIVVKKGNEAVEIFNIEKLKALFLLVSALGGFGKRVRRGFGSFKITEINKKPNDKSEYNIENLIKIVNPSFNFNLGGNWPIIQGVAIGKNDTTTKNISQATHDVKYKSGNGVKFYDATIGAGWPRFASPIYISILPDGKPVITTLKTISPNKKNVKIDIQKELKDKIL